MIAAIVGPEIPALFSPDGLASMPPSSTYASRFPFLSVPISRFAQAWTRVSPNSVLAARRPELDALRVIAFGLLILYHVGMLYTANWGFHYKSAYRSETLESLMVLVNVWRMALLWLISGIALHAVLTRLSPISVLFARTQRLLIPLFIGVWLIVPPQLYAEMSQAGVIDMDYLSFYRHFLDLDDPLFANYQAGIWPHVNVNHLWYLRELWTYSLLLLVLHPLLQTGRVQALAEHVFARGGLLRRVLLPGALMAVLLIATQMDREMEGLGFLVFGYLIGNRPGFWSALFAQRKALLATALTLLATVLVLYQLIWIDPELRKATHWQLLGAITLALTAWSCLLAILALSQNRFQNPGVVWRYLQDAVLPYYILHQSALIVAAMWLSPYALGPVWEPMAVVMCTVLTCALGFELIRRVALLRWSFGLKATSVAVASKKPSLIYRVARGVLAAGLVLFGLEIVL